VKQRWDVVNKRLIYRLI